MEIKLDDNEKLTIAVAYDLWNREEFLLRIYRFIDERVALSIDHVTKIDSLNREFTKQMDEFKNIVRHGK